MTIIGARTTLHASISGTHVGFQCEYAFHSIGNSRIFLNAGERVTSPSFCTAHTGYEPVEGRRNSTPLPLLARFQRSLARLNGLVFWHFSEFSADTLIRIFVF